MKVSSMPWFETITDLAQGAETLRRRRYGMIEAVDGRFRRVVLRPFPKLASLPEIAILGGMRHQFAAGDFCRLYYNQPWRFPKFLALKYVVSGSRGSLASLRLVLDILDEIARLKGSDAILCDVANGRISQRLMARWGWEPHCRSSRWHRHYIKRFYGTYPSTGVSPTQVSLCGY